MWSHDGVKKICEERKQKKAKKKKGTNTPSCAVAYSTARAATTATTAKKPKVLLPIHTRWGQHFRKWRYAYRRDGCCVRVAELLLKVNAFALWTPTLDESIDRV